MMKSDQSKTIAVLGMHRSGTSMMGGILNSLGMSQGSGEQLSSNQYNIKGYFENREIMRCNDKILSSQVNQTIVRIHDSDSFVDKATLDGFGWVFGAWVNQVEIEKGDADYSKFINNALNIYIDKGAGKELRFIKDPRMSLTLTKWFKEIMFDAAVVMVRNPEDVAKSLFYRDQIIDYISYDLWQLYTCNALLRVQKIPHLIVDYETFLSDKHQMLEMLLGFLKDTIDLNPTDRARKAALLSVEQDLNHNRKYPSVNAPPENINSLYYRLKKGKIDDMENEFNHRFSQAKDNWAAALYVAEKNKRIYYTSQYRERIERLNRHVIVGNILSALRRIKKDQTFGSLSDL